MNTDIQRLYHELIIDHGRHPRNFGSLPTATHQQEGHNPLCGDQILLALEIRDGKIIDLRFEGQGCAISMASASLMTQAIKHLSLEDAKDLLSRFLALLHQEARAETDLENLGKLAVFQNVSEYPARVKCAALAWRALEAALAGNSNLITTE